MNQPGNCRVFARESLLFCIAILLLICQGCKRTIATGTPSLSAADHCAKSYPNPIIDIDHKTAEAIFISVTNRSDYSEEMFRQAPDLPPCGLNSRSSRTWIEIYNANNIRIYGHCAVNSIDTLKSLGFSTRMDIRSGVYIVMNDRSCKRQYKSNTIHF